MERGNTGLNIEELHVSKNTIICNVVTQHFSKLPPHVLRTPDTQIHQTMTLWCDCRDGSSSIRLSFTPTSTKLVVSWSKPWHSASFQSMNCEYFDCQ